MKADISLAERRLLEREQQAEIRAALGRLHDERMEEEQAIAYYWFVHALHLGPALRETLARLAHGPVSVPITAPVAIPEPEPVVPPAPLVVRPGAPDVPFDLRHRLGLQ